MHIATKIVITFVAVAIALLHQFHPSIELDGITLTLLAISLLPWILPYVSELDFFGLKIDLRKAQSATSKVNIDVETSKAHLSLKGYKPTVTVSSGDDWLSTFRSIVETDPNLAMVAFRIEIEQRIRELVRANGLLNERVGLSRMVRALVSKNILDSKTGSGLLELVALGNQAAHGSKVSSEAANWVLAVGPGILMQLDDILNQENAS